MRSTSPSPALLQLAAAMTEADFQLQVTSGTRREPGLCAQLHLKWWHTFNSQRSPGGWMDLVIAGPGGALFWELKTEAGKVTAAQQECLDLLAAAGLSTGVRRPSDLLSGRIARELAVIAGLPVREAP